MAESYLFGKNAVIEALNSDRKIAKIFITFNLQGSSVSTIYRLAKDKGIPCVRYDKNKFAELERKSDAANKSQGIIAFIEPINTLDIDDMLNRAFKKQKNPIIVVLDEVSDVHNLGAIARTAEIVGASGIIIPERNAAPVTAAAVRISAGALNHIDVAKVGNLQVALQRIKKRGFWIYGAAADGTKQINEKIWDSPVCLIIGSEDKGIKQSIRKDCDFLVKIPMLGKTESLNASVAASVILYEILRQRDYKIV